MLLSAAVLFLLAGFVEGIGFELVHLNGLYYITAFIHSGAQSTYDYSTMTQVEFFVDTINLNNFVFGDDALCPTCPSTATDVATGLFQFQTSMGAIGFGKNRKVYGKMGVTEIGIASDGDELSPQLNWLQESLFTSRTVNIPDASQYSGNLALGRSESNGKYETILGSLTGLMDGDSTFCLDLGLFYTGRILEWGSAVCNSIESESCGMVTTLPIYQASEPTWNVAMTSFQVTSNADFMIAFSGRVIVDTTREFAVFPRSIAQQLADYLTSAFGADSVTEYYVDGYYEYIFQGRSLSTDYDLLINFSSYDPLTSDMAKFFRVIGLKLITNSLATFYGSTDPCIIGSESTGYKAIIGTAFMEGNYFGFHPGYITIIQPQEE